MIIGADKTLLLFISQSITIGKHVIMINICMPIPTIDPSFIENQQLCSYGCNQSAKYKFINSGNFCCSRVHNSCPANKNKNSIGLKNSGRDYKSDYNNLPQSTKNRMAWATGLTKETDIRIEKMSRRMTGKRKITDEVLLEKIIYRDECSFNINGIIEKIRGYNLLKIYGMYSKNNPNGVVRDHRISVNYGFIHKIDSKIISHPANCEFLQHKDNARKTFKNSITIDQLLEDIKKWCV
jgi:hypothetical protein